jgi:hypothetical protein
LTKNGYANVILTVFSEQSGAAEARWAHNPEVRRSKLRPAKDQDRLPVFPHVSVYLVTGSLYIDNVFVSFIFVECVVVPKYLFPPRIELRTSRV